MSETTIDTTQIAQASANAIRAGTIVGAFAGLGLRQIVHCPGSRNTPLVLAANALGVRIHPVLDERSAAFFALGLARYQGTAVALVATSGSAPSHFLPAVIEAAHSEVPLIVLSANRPIELQRCGAPQTTEQSQLFIPHTRACEQLDAPGPAELQSDWVVSACGRLWAAAHGVPAGPVHLDCPFREPLWHPRADAPREPARQLSLIRGRASLSSEQLEAALVLLDRPRGLVVCGPLSGPASGALQTAAAIARLAAHRGWPVIADPGSPLRFCAHSTEVLTSPDALTRALSALPRQQTESLLPDVVLRFGQPPVSKAVNRWVARPGLATVICDSAGRLRDPDHRATMLLAADEELLCNQLVSRLPTVSAGARSFAQRWYELDNAAELALADALKKPAPRSAGPRRTQPMVSLDRSTLVPPSELEAEAENPAWEGPLVRALLSRLPAGCLLHLANSMPIRDVDCFAGAVPQSLMVYTSRGVNGIDGTVATACGEAAIHPSLTIVLLGDLALLHDSGSLHALAAKARDLLLVIVDNAGGGIFSYLPIAEHHPQVFEPYFITKQAQSIAKLLHAVGIETRSISTAEQIGPALEWAFEQAGPRALHVRVDRERSVAAHGRCYQAATNAVAGALTALLEQRR